MKKIYLLFLLVSLFSVTSCDNSKHPCYDGSLVHDNLCQANCPGFQGCDGKIYCNECEAARQGIGPN